MKITFRKISRYAVPKTSTRVADLLIGELDPPSLRNEPRVTDTPTLCSTALRARMSITGLKINYTDRLEEIKFDPVKILGLKSNTINSQQVREAFIRGWISNQLAKSRQQIIQDTIWVIKQAKHYPHCLVISHTFRLTIIRAYLIEGGCLLQEPKLIHKYIQPENKLLAFDQEFSYSN